MIPATAITLHIDTRLASHRGHYVNPAVRGSYRHLHSDYRDDERGSSCNPHSGNPQGSISPFGRPGLICPRSGTIAMLSDK